MSDREHEEPRLTRRKFIQTASAVTAGATAASVLGSACTRMPEAKLEPPTDAQKAGKRQTDSTIAIAGCDSYDHDIFSLLKPFLKNADLPDFHGKVVLIKPNMIDSVPGRPLTTEPAVVKAAVDLANALGAREIIIAEGAAHNRDTQYLLANSGIGALVTKLGLQYVDLNIDDLEKVENPLPFSRLDHFYLPKTVVKADAVISVPKLKTHHWARMTCSMKNLYGCIPGRKYGYPKNVLHYHGIDNCILDINRLIKSPIQLVDAVVAMEGDGPIMGEPKKANFIMLGNDAAATDASCARIIGLHVANVPYIRYAGEVIGNIDENHIKVLGLPIARVATQFKPAPSFDATGKSVKFEDPNQSSS